LLTLILLKSCLEANFKCCFFRLLI